MLVINEKLLTGLEWDWSGIGTGLEWDWNGLDWTSLTTRLKSYLDWRS